nr:beta-glucosidase [uncultured bacterium]
MEKYFASTSNEVTATETAHGELSRSLAGECVVLLENNGVLPIPPDGRIALFGNGARNTVKGGTGSGDVNTRTNITIEQGLVEAGYTIVTTDWLDRNQKIYDEAKRYYIEEYIPKKAAEEDIPEFLATFNEPFLGVDPLEITDDDISDTHTDTAIYVISRNSGEGSDRRNVRGDYQLFEQERESIEVLAHSFSKLIVVLNVGGVIDMSELKAIHGIDAILLMSQLGNISGQVLADVLSGKVNPSGKLTDTWAKSYSDYPSSATFSSNDGDVNDEYYTEGIFVGYRYFDTFGIEPIYPFGYGKSYTTFDIRLDGAELVDLIGVKVNVTVVNTGNVAGKEVVQVYYSAPAGKLPKPYQELIVFAKTDELEPGQSQKLELFFDARDMASYCEECASWVLEPGDYFIRVGAHSRATYVAAIVTLDERVKTAQLKNLFALDEPMEEIKRPAAVIEAIPEEVPQLFLKAADIPCETVSYQGARTELTTEAADGVTVADIKAGNAGVDDLVAQLTVEELANYCVGTLRAEGGSIVGNASYTVPGAAGDTSSICKESRGIKNLVLADGPAGLRLQPVFKTDLEGNLLPGGSVLGDSYEPFDPSLDDTNSITYYQYCTAIPIGWALAQAWNPTLLEQVGSMVGEEMVQFGVDIWLAPALNVHRNPLCGRNFEYYSEDPLVGGLAAAAITRGVQSHEGKGTCIKHFAANNQENNRYFTNSHISERAMREIYCKGFEIAIKQSQPLTIMTSYNLINGTHTANYHDLLQGVARDECGFAGFVMTDWFTSQDIPAFTGGSTKYPISASTGCVYAGNDNQQPGCLKNVTDLIEAVESGEEKDGFAITKADLQFCAANVIRIAVECDTEV